jgi:hypothetical protein
VYPRHRVAVHRKQCNDFKSLVLSWPRTPSRPEDCFPGKVKYAQRCGLLCARTTPAQTMLLYTKLRAAIKSCAERFGPSSELAKMDVVLAVEVFKDGSGPRPDAVCFVDMRLATSQSGAHAPTQTFLKLEPAGGAAELPLEYQGLTLRYAHKGLVQHQGQTREPMSRVVAGAFVAWTEDALCIEVLLNLCPQPDGMNSKLTLIQKVAIRQLVYEDISLRDVRITGCSQAFGHKWVEAGPAPVQRRPAIQAPDFVDLSQIFHETKTPGPLRDRAARTQSQSEQSVLVGPALTDTEQIMLDALGLQAGDLSLTDAQLRDLAPLAGDDIAPEAQEEFAALLDLLVEAGEEEGGESSGSDAEGGPQNPHETNRWSHLGLVQRPGWQFFTEAGLARGCVHAIGAGSMKATCRVHSKCICWLSNVVDVTKTESDLVSWLADPGDSRSAHQLSAYELKAAYGMNVRRP